eukprot:COSAG01_NODE_107_length_25964_cov_174.577576_25_plen_89_part_00
MQEWLSVEDSFRPWVCVVVSRLCRGNMLRANRERYERSAGACKGFCLDLFLLGRLPHAPAVLLTLCAALLVSGWLFSNSFCLGFLTGY